MKINKLHDRFVKETLGNVEVTRSFLVNYLPENIMHLVDLTTLQPQKDSYINKDLVEGYSDLLFKAVINGTEGYFYFLIKHKSFNNKDTVLQLLNYMIFIWQTKLNKEHVKTLPVIFPLVIYHSGKNWLGKKTLGEMIEGFINFPIEIQKYVPDYEYLLFDISGYKDHELYGLPQLRILFLMLRDVSVKKGEELWNTVERALEHLSEIEDQQTEREFFQTMMLYLFSASKTLTKQHMNVLSDRIQLNYPERRDDLMSLADILRDEGKEKGIEQGKKEMEKEKNRQFVHNLLDEGFDINSIAKLTELTREEVEKIISDLKN